jgi:ribosome-binding factor A
MGRVERVTQTIKRELSNIIHDELKDPRVGFVTLTRVEVTKDLRIAKVYYSVLGNDKEKKNSVIALESAKGFMRRLIGERIDLKFVPELIFKEDRSIEYSIFIEQELEKLKNQNEHKKNSQTSK